MLIGSGQKKGQKAKYFNENETGLILAWDNYSGKSNFFVVNSLIQKTIYERP
jgi:hypothetical protein